MISSEYPNMRIMRKIMSNPGGNGNKAAQNKNEAD